MYQELTTFLLVDFLAWFKRRKTPDRNQAVNWIAFKKKSNKEPLYKLYLAQVRSNTVPQKI